MIEGGLTDDDGVLVRAEEIQAMFEKIIPEPLSVFPAHRHPEIVKLAKMRGEFALHDVHHGPGRRIRFELRDFRKDVARVRAFTVQRVVVPLAALGDLALHQKVGLATHLAIEGLHEERLFTTRFPGELGPITEKHVIRSHFDGNILGFHQLDQLSTHSKFGALH